MLTEEKAFALQVSVLQYIARTDARLQLARDWEKVKGQLDIALRHNWEMASKSGVRLHTWLRNKRELLCLYIHAAIVDSFVDCEGAFETVPSAVKNVMDSGFLTGVSLFLRGVACVRKGTLPEGHAHGFERLRTQQR